jgi:two-component system response regulator (stage 0 sporulation protein F)
MSSLGRILVVDDEAEVVAVLREFLSGNGYTVVSATNGAEAINEVTRRRPDLVLLDINMPGIDGMEVLKRVHARDPSIGVIMITANEDLELARRTLDLGAFDYIAKPFDFGHLERVVLAGMMTAADRAAGPADGSPAPAFHRLAVAVFRAVRGLSDLARASVGERLEASALAALRHAAAGDSAEAGRMLDDLALLVRLAADLGDLSPVERSTIESALGAARKTEAARG